VDQLATQSFNTRSGQSLADFFKKDFLFLQQQLETLEFNTRSSLLQILIKSFGKKVSSAILWEILFLCNPLELFFPLGSSPLQSLDAYHYYCCCCYCV